MKKVTFSVSTGYVGSKKEETYNLVDLGIIKEEYETEKDFTDAIDESFQEWILDNVDATWDFEEE